MCTVTVSAPGSGSVSSFKPFDSCHSVIPSTLWVFFGASAASAAVARKRKRRKKKRFI